MIAVIAPFSHLPSDLIGSTAAVCTTISFLPQLIRVWQRKSASDISLTMFLLFSFGVACWLVYGIGIGSLPIIAANTVTLILALAILTLKLCYDRKPVIEDEARATDN
ncbi:MAG: SemiSWEET transporter [Terracidiphilus sp.]|jgi:MtN3 and saliva related transmembrane protein